MDARIETLLAQQRGSDMITQVLDIWGRFRENGNLIYDYLDTNRLMQCGQNRLWVYLGMSSSMFWYVTACSLATQM